jgi:hypothetical protein
MFQRNSREASEAGVNWMAEEVVTW